MDELMRWRCREGHTLGFVRRNGSKVRQLLLLREAIDDPAKASIPEGKGEAMDDPAKASIPEGEGKAMDDPAKASIPEGKEEEGVDVMAVVEGYVADVRCSICGSVRTWVPGEEALRRMLRGRELG